MPKTKTIHLVSPIDIHGQHVDRVELREPSGAMYAEHGEPRILVRGQDNAYFVQVNTSIQAYLRKCVVHEHAAALLQLLSLADEMQLKDGLFDFFMEAEASVAAKRQTNSSSTSAASATTPLN